MPSWETVYSSVHEEEFLEWLQRESEKWRTHSFPIEHRTPPLQALGVAEEAGELAHGVLKMEQGIRGDVDEHKEKIGDAAGDIVIYLCGLMNSLGMDLQTEVEKAWNQVAQRDWSKYKFDGHKMPLGPTHAEQGPVAGDGSPEEIVRRD